MSKVIMVTGGSRSGKSVLAEKKAREYGKRSVLYIATAIPVAIIPPTEDNAESMYAQRL